MGRLPHAGMLVVVGGALKLWGDRPLCGSSRPKKAASRTAASKAKA